MPLKSTTKQTREQRNETQRKYREARRQELVEKQQEYYKVHCEAIKAKERARRIAKREYITEQQRAYRAANRDRISARKKAYNAEHPEKNAARLRAWKAANPDRRIALHHARRAQKAGNGGSHTTAEWRALCEWFGNVCLCCGVAEKLSRDHVVPLNKGGANAIANLQPICVRCNSAKQTKIIDYRDPVRLAAFLESLKGMTDG